MSLSRASAFSISTCLEPSSCRGARRRTAGRACGQGGVEQHRWHRSCRLPPPQAAPHLVCGQPGLPPRISVLKAAAQLAVGRHLDVQLALQPARLQCQERGGQRGEWWLRRHKTTAARAARRSEHGGNSHGAGNTALLDHDAKCQPCVFKQVGHGPAHKHQTESRRPLPSALPQPPHLSPQVVPNPLRRLGGLLLGAGWCGGPAGRPGRLGNRFGYRTSERRPAAAWYWLHSRLVRHGHSLARRRSRGERAGERLACHSASAAVHSCWSGAAV